jgi:hypothetical protein
MAKPKMMSLVTLSASATVSSAAVNGSKSSVGPGVSAADGLDGASKRAHDHANARSNEDRYRRKYRTSSNCSENHTRKKNVQRNQSFGGRWALSARQSVRRSNHDICSISLQKTAP